MEKPRLIEDLGLQFPCESSKKRSQHGMYICGVCGRIFRCKKYAINTGLTKSCGCYQTIVQRERKLTHGMSRTKIYAVWQSMKARCYKETDKRFSYYGSRGISVCDEWKNNPMAFINWGLNNGYRNGLELNRIDNDGNYEPQNCNWVGDVENGENTRLINARNTSGYRGIICRPCADGTISYRVEIKHNKQKYNLGSYKSINDAISAWNNFVVTHNTLHPLNIID